jgi:predicted ester cyclase
VACFTPEGSYVDGFFGPHAGHANLRAMFERMFHEGTDYQWTMETIVDTPTRAAAEWTFSYVVSDAVPRSAGRRVRFTGMSVFDLDGGRIAAYRESFDLGAALLQLGFKPDALSRVIARKHGLA